MEGFCRRFTALFSFVILDLILLCDSQLTVSIEVDRSDVVKTGIRKYIAKDSSSVTITCSSILSVPGNISLLDSDGLVIEANFTSETGITLVRKSLERPQGKCHCVISILTWNSNGLYCEFHVSGEVEIVAQPTLPHYALSIGNSGYVGERAYVTFTHETNYVYNCFGEQWSTQNMREVFIDNTFPENTCICLQNCGTSYGCSVRCHDYDIHCTRSGQECSELKLFVYPFVQLNITEYNVSLDNSVMQFSCNSTPPRLIYWKVFGFHGNLLDIDNLNQSFKVNTTVNITQSPGEISLRIWEAVPGGNGIHTVMCSTYDAEIRVATVHRIGNTLKCNLNCETPTGMQVTPYSNPITTVDRPSSTFAMTTYERSTLLGDFEVASTEQGYEKIDTINDFFLAVVVSLPHLLIITVLTGIICYMYYKNRNKMELQTEVPAQYTSSDVVLHDNPTYEPFSETKDCNHDDVKAEKEVVYTNL